MRRESASEIGLYLNDNLDAMKLFYTFFALLAIVACTVQTNIHFNEDFSGNIEYVIDMSEAAAMLDDTAKTESIFEEEDMQEAVEDLKNMEGVTNVQTNEDLNNAVYKLSMDFNSIETLNKILSEGDPVSGFYGDLDNTEENQNLHFEQKKNKLYIHMMDLSELQKEFQESSEEESYMGAGELFTYQLNFTFEKEVKKIKTKGIATQSGDKVQFSLNMDQLIELESLDQDIQVVLK
jgi:methionine synthase II (cobalamin-independent)